MITLRYADRMTGGNDRQIPEKMEGIQMKKTRYFESFAEYHDFYEENGHEINRVDVVAGPLWIVADAEIECRGWRTALRRFESALAEDEQLSWTVGYYADAKRVDDVDGRFYNDCDGYMIEELSEGVWYVAARTAVKTAEDDETETAAEDNTTGGSTMYTLNDYIRDTADLPAAELRETIRNLRDAVAMLDHICADHILNEKTPAETVAAYVAALDASKWVQEVAIDGREIAEIIIASLVNRSAWDGRISRASAEWARAVQDCMEEGLCDRLRIYTQMHMVHLDQIARAMMAYEPQETETGDETAEESSEDQSEEETGEDIPGPSETVADSFALPTDSDRVRAICERIAENIAEYATMPVDSLDICIADGNEKVGHIKNVSQPPVISCRGVCAECGGDCYDGRAVLQYPDTAAARARNWSIYCRDPLSYFGQIIGTVRRMRKRFFRWHVGGEIVDGLYFRLMIATARLAPRVTFLCFTKRHKLVADELSAMGGRDALPANLRLILSAWPGLPLYNPYDLPVSAPYAGDKPRTWYGCPGNCEECAARNIGCWSLPAGAVVGFAYHGTAGDLFAERFAAWEDRPTGRRPKRTASSKEGRETA